MKSLVFSIFLFLLTILTLCQQQQQTTPQIQTIITQFAEPLQEWVGFNRSVVQVAKQCKMQQLQSELLNFHIQLASIGEDFTRQHLDAINKEFKQQHHVKQFFKCMVDKRHTQNQFFKEQRKFKHLAQFIKQYPHYSSQIFYADDKPIDKGYRLGRFFRAFFEYYYQHVLHPAETASTKLIRAMTPRTDLFEHEDISPCLTLQTSGKISESLQNLGIQNIYLNVPQAFDAIKYMKFKPKCKSQKYNKMLDEIHKRLQKIDMFKVMYHEYNPWVQIAAEKYGNKQIQQIAIIFCKIIQNQEHYQQLSAIEQM